MPGRVGQDELRRRAVLILSAIVKAGGEAGGREIWLRVNQPEHRLVLRQVEVMLAKMNEQGHVTVTHEQPRTWKATALGLEWLRKEKKK